MPYSPVPKLGIAQHDDVVRDSYTRIVPYRKGERIRLTGFPDVELAVTDILR